MALELKYFILEPKGSDEFARASRVAMLAYANEIKDTDQGLAIDLRIWAYRESGMVTKQNLSSEDSDG